MSLSTTAAREEDTARYKRAWDNSSQELREAHYIRLQIERNTLRAELAAAREELIMRRPDADSFNAILHRIEFDDGTDGDSTGYIDPVDYIVGIVNKAQEEASALPPAAAMVSTDAWIAPEGFRAIAPNAYVSDTHIIVTGTPHPTEDETDSRYHNCDAMGCGREHVVYRARLTSRDAGT